MATLVQKMDKLKKENDEQRKKNRYTESKN